MSKKVVIIGGVAGGASCAARLRRLDETAEIVLLERGPYISYANCGLPYHVGDVIKSRNALLLQTPEAMKQKFTVDVRVKNEAVAINRDQKTVTVKRADTGETYTGPCLVRSAFGVVSLDVVFPLAVTGQLVVDLSFTFEAQTNVGPVTIFTVVAGEIVQTIDFTVQI